MKSFRFSLEQALRHREWLEDKARRDLAREQQRRREILGELEELAARMERFAPGAAAGAAIDAAGRLLALDYARHLAGLREEKGAALEEQERRVAERGEALRAAARARKVLEKLRERQHRRYRKERGRYLAARLDEASAEFLRRRSGERA